MTHIHNTSIIDDNVEIGNGTKIWHWVHVCQGAKIGSNCVLGQNVYVGPNVVIGNNVKIQNNGSVYSGVTIQDDVFLGPSCVLTNDLMPDATNPNWKITKTLIKKGASVGVNATIVCGNTIGCNSLVAAGSVVTKDVPDYALVMGNPAKLYRYLNK